MGVLLELYEEELVEENVVREETVDDELIVEELVVVADAVGEEGVSASPRNSDPGFARRMYSPLFPHVKLM